MRGREIDSTYLTSNSKAIKMKFEFTKKKLKATNQNKFELFYFKINLEEIQRNPRT
jgi:hypothetical protein